MVIILGMMVLRNSHVEKVIIREEWVISRINELVYRKCQGLYTPVNPPLIHSSLILAAAAAVAVVDQHHNKFNKCFRIRCTLLLIWFRCHPCVLLHERRPHPRARCCRPGNPQLLRRDMRLSAFWSPSRLYMLGQSFHDTDGHKKSKKKNKP